MLIQDLQRNYERLEGVHLPDCNHRAVSDIAAVLLYRSDAFPYLSPKVRRAHELRLQRRN